MKNIGFLFVFLVVSIFAIAQEKTVTRSFKGISKIRLSTSSGDIALKKSTSTEVKLTVKYSYDENEYKPVIEEGDGRLTLKENFSSGSHSGQSNWTLELPDKTSININTGSGEITIDQLNIDVKSNSGSGNVTIAGVKGDLDFNTGSGNIEISDADGEISLNVGSGNVDASRSNGSLSFNAGSGNIKLNDVKGDFQMNVGSGSIRAKNIVVKSSSSFNSGSGDATVTLGAPLEYSISVNSGSGNSTLNFNNTAINGEVVMSANKRNGNIVAPFKFDKEEEIDDNGNSQTRIQKTAKLGDKDIRIKVGTGSGTAEITK